MMFSFIIYFHIIPAKKMKNIAWQCYAWFNEWICFIADIDIGYLHTICCTWLWHVNIDLLKQVLIWVKYVLLVLYWNLLYSFLLFQICQ